MPEFAVCGPLVITRHREGDARVLTLMGELDLASVPSLDLELMQAETGRGCHIVVDLGGLEFMDSSGLSLLIAANDRLRNNGHTLSLLRGPPTVHRLFELSQAVNEFRFDG